MGEVGERRGPLGLQAEPAVEQRGAEPEGERERGRGQPERLAGVVGRCVGVAVDGARRTDRETAREPACCVGPPAQHRGELGAVRRDEVERDEVDAVLLRGRDAGLVPSLEGDRGRHGGAGGRLLAAQDRGGAETGDAKSGPAGGEAEQPAAREAVAHETTAEVSSDSGSDSASTCAASALTCAGVSAL